MAERTQVELELVALTRDAKKSVDSFANDTQKRLSSISFAQTVTAISTGFLAVKAAGETAMRAVSVAFAQSVGEAAEAEQANFRLANSLRLVGGYSEDVVSDFQSLGAQIQKTTSFSDDAVIAAAGLAKGFQLTNKEVKNLIPVATDLAAFLGTDLNTAATSLARTFNGDLDKTIAKNIKGLKGLSDAQLNAGEAIRIIGERVKGTAAAFSGTFNGTMEQFKNSFSDIFEEFGTAVIKTPELAAAIRSLGTQFGILAKFIGECSPEIAALTASFIRFATTGTIVALQLYKALSELFAFVAGGAKQAALNMKGIAEIYAGVMEAIFIDSKKGTERVQKAISDIKLNPFGSFFDEAQKNKDKVKSAFDPLINGAKKVRDEIGKAADKAKGSLGLGNVSEGDLAALRAAQKEKEKVLQEFEGKRKELTMLGLTEIQKLERQSAATSELINKARNLGIIKSDKERDTLLLALQKDTSDKMVKLKKEEQDRIRAETQKFADGPASAIAGAISSGASITQAQGVAAGAGFLKAVLQGAEGAKQAVSSILGAAADVLIPGLGGVVSEIVGVLAQGPEKTKQMVQEFARAIPQIIENLVASLPVLIETLARELPPALAKVMPQVAFGFSAALIKNIPNIVKGFAQGFVDAAKQAGQALIDLIKDIPGDIFGGISGKDSGGIFEGIPVLGGIGDVFGFAEGGRVPDLSQYRGDRFPARLNAGEQVLDRDLSQDLENFLKGSGGGQPQTAIFNIQMGLETFARLALECDRRGFRLRAV